MKKPMPPAQDEPPEAFAVKQRKCPSIGAPRHKQAPTVVPSLLQPQKIRLGQERPSLRIRGGRALQSQHGA
ncbi:hypothetical protein NDU88_004566 [Pleurodeles waltl]|uniref:Uncharacterized protein n=1 Tax=Pleurodeles waltl TaxID=8319 RepID=A0AAV7N1T6_PLEWA|nr:hypothetical protein NDU88_004566 [Pleurodeles waltl]